MIKIMILIGIFMILIPLTFAYQDDVVCQDTYGIYDDVLIQDRIESFGDGADCEINIMGDNGINITNNMAMHGLMYSFNAGSLPTGSYVSGIECNLTINASSYSLFLSGCNFKVEREVKQNMNIYDWLFILQFIGILIIFGGKFYNLTREGQGYKFVWSIMGFFGYFLIWGIGFVILMLDPLELIYVSLFKLETWLILLNVVFFIGEIFFMLKQRTLATIQSYGTGKSQDSGAYFPQR